MQPDLGDGTSHRRRLLERGVGSDLGKHTSPTTERVDTRAVRTTTPTSAASNITFLQQGYKPKHKNKGSEENKQFASGGKEEKPPPWNAAVILSFLFLGGALGHGGLAACTSCLFVCVFLSVLFYVYAYYQVIIFSQYFTGRH